MRRVRQGGLGPGVPPGFRCSLGERAKRPDLAAASVLPTRTICKMRPTGCLDPLREFLDPACFRCPRFARGLSGRTVSWPDGCCPRSPFSCDPPSWIKTRYGSRCVYLREAPTDTSSARRPPPLFLPQVRVLVNGSMRFGCLPVTFESAVCLRRSSAHVFSGPDDR